MNSYTRFDRVEAQVAFKDTFENRERARKYLRWGSRAGHYQFMQEALRAWKRYRYYSKRLVQ